MIASDPSSASDESLADDVSADFLETLHGIANGRQAKIRERQFLKEQEDKKDKKRQKRRETRKRVLDRTPFFILVRDHFHMFYLA